MLLLEKIHLPFEQWFIRLFLTGQLPEPCSIIVLRGEYLNLCWKEEDLWRKWSENVQNIQPPISMW